MTINQPAFLFRYVWNSITSSDSPPPPPPPPGRRLKILVAVILFAGLLKIFLDKI